MSRLNETLYNLPFISQELIDTLDWAWLIDFGQGDFERAKAMTEVALLSEWNASNLLARALVHQLQGEFSRAISLLKQALVIAKTPTNKLIITTIIYLIERKKKENLLDGCSLSTTKAEIDILWKEKTKHFKQEIQDLGSRLEINLIQQIASILPCWRTTIVQQQDSQLKQQYQELILEQLTEQLELYQGKEYYAIANFFYYCFADLLALSGQFIAAWELLENLAPAHLNSEQYLATAWYLMSQGDLIVETNSFGKPIVFGYKLLDCYLHFPKIELLNRSKIDTASAQQKYLEARQYFAMTGAKRGEAMAVTRLAYVNALQEQWHLAACGYEEAKKTFSDLGDNLNAIAAEMGYLWSVSQYKTLEDRSIIDLETSIAWMLQHQTITFALSWVLAFTAAAREALVKEEGVAISQRLIAITETILTQAIDRDTINTDLSCYQLWKRCNQNIAYFYRYLAVDLARQDNWQAAFIIGEKVKLYGLQSQIINQERSDNFRSQLDNIFSISEIANILPSNTILLSFVVTSNKLLGWGITNKGALVQYLLEEIETEEFQANNLEQTINIWLHNLLDSDPDSRLNQVLEKIFLEPFASEIESKQHLILSLCDRLQGLSFAAIQYHYQSNSNILKKEVFLGEEKTISYLLFVSQLAECQLIATATNKVLIVTEQEEVIVNQQIDRPIKTVSNLSLSRVLARAVSQLYSISPLNNLNQITQEILDLMDFKPLIHLFINQSNYSLLNRFVRHNINSELIILSIQDIPIRTLPGKKLNRLAQTTLDAGAKTVVIIFDSEDSLATAILTSFFHQGLYFGQTIAESLRQAQKQLRLVTAQDALDFCNYLQSHIPWQSNSDRALRALITKYTGDVMVLGKDYHRATEAYAVAIKILEEIGYSKEVKSLQNKYKMFKSLKKITKPFQAKRLIFDVPAYWNNVYIYGDWQLSFVGL